MSDQTGRNDPCPCGSGKKYKKCCGKPGMGKHTVQVISSSATSSLLGRINAAGTSIQSEKAAAPPAAEKPIHVTTVNKKPVEGSSEKE